MKTKKPNKTWFLHRKIWFSICIFPCFFRSFVLRSVYSLRIDDEWVSVFTVQCSPNRIHTHTVHVWRMQKKTNSFSPRERFCFAFFYPFSVLSSVRAFLTDTQTRIQILEEGVRQWQKLAEMMIHNNQHSTEVISFFYIFFSDFISFCVCILRLFFFNTDRDKLRSRFSHRYKCLEFDTIHQLRERQFDWTHTHTQIMMIFHSFHSNFLVSLEWEYAVLLARRRRHMFSNKSKHKRYNDNGIE